MVEKYEIRVKGQCDADWSDWFDHLTITSIKRGEAKLYGSFLDQSALYGLLAFLHSQDLVLISVSRVVDNQTSQEQMARLGGYLPRGKGGLEVSILTSTHKIPVVD